MAGYVKVWTLLRSNKEFLSLSGMARGVYLQLLVAAKDQRDDGTVCYRSVAALGSECGCDRRTASKVLTCLEQKCLINVTKMQGQTPNPSNSVIEIYLPNYKLWQEITVDEMRKRGSKNVAKIPSLRPDQSRPKQSKAKQSRVKKIPDTDHARLIDFWMKVYEKRFGDKYDFKGNKDGPIIKRMLTNYGIDKSCQIMETFLNTDDDFYRKAGWTLGVLSGQINKMIQRPILADDPLSKFSPNTQKTIVNMRNILERDKQNENAGKT